MRFFTFLSKKTSRFMLLLLMMFSWVVAWGQTVAYQTGFESSEGFTASTTYNNSTRSY